MVTEKPDTALHNIFKTSKYFIHGIHDTGIRNRIQLIQKYINHLFVELLIQLTQLNLDVQNYFYHDLEI